MYGEYLDDAFGRPGERSPARGRARRCAGGDPARALGGERAGARAGPSAARTFSAGGAARNDEIDPRGCEGDELSEHERARLRHAEKLQLGATRRAAERLYEGRKGTICDELARLGAVSIRLRPSTGPWRRWLAPWNPRGPSSRTRRAPSRATRRRWRRALPLPAEEERLPPGETLTEARTGDGEPSRASRGAGARAGGTGRRHRGRTGELEGEKGHARRRRPGRRARCPRQRRDARRSWRTPSGAELPVKPGKWDGRASSWTCNRRAGTGMLSGGRRGAADACGDQIAWSFSSRSTAAEDSRPLRRVASGGELAIARSWP